MNELNKVRTFWNEKWESLNPPSPTKKSDYFISNYGRIKSVSKLNSEERLLKGSTIRGSYRQLNIRLAGKGRYSVYIHRFVAEKFLPAPHASKKFVVHLDGNNANNHWQNLQWMDQEELTKWQISRGIFKSENKKRGSNTKLTETKVLLLKKWVKEGKTKKKILAKRMGISTMQLNRIERGENWAHVKLGESGILNE